MGEFIAALRDPNIAFLRYAFIVGILASVAFGIVGTYIVTRRITYIAGAISHCMLGGIGAALYVQQTMGVSWIDPIYGAIAAALVAAFVIGLVSICARQREDTVIGALWATGMAIGLLFLAKTPRLQRSHELSIREYFADIAAGYLACDWFGRARRDSCRLIS